VFSFAKPTSEYNPPIFSIKSTHLHEPPLKRLRHITKMSSQLFDNKDQYPPSPTIRSEESGYASATSSQDGLTEVYFSKPHLKFINAQLQQLEPQG
jgi:hypothetical protein